MKKIISMLAVLLVFGIAFAGYDDQIALGSAGNISTALQGVKSLLCNILPVVVMLAIVIAALLYAVGQLGSAESRSKFHGWATGIVIGAITALLVLLITPVLLGGLLGDSSLVACGSEGGNTQQGIDPGCAGQVQACVSHGGLAGGCAPGMSIRDCCISYYCA